MTFLSTPEVHQLYLQPVAYGKMLGNSVKVRKETSLFEEEEKQLLWTAFLRIFRELLLFVYDEIYAPATSTAKKSKFQFTV